MVTPLPGKGQHANPSVVKLGLLLEVLPQTRLQLLGAIIVNVIHAHPYLLVGHPGIVTTGVYNL